MIALVTAAVAVSSSAALVAIAVRAGQDILALLFIGLAVTMVVSLAGVCAAGLPRRRQHLRVIAREGGVEVVGSRAVEWSGVLLALVLTALAGVQLVLAMRSEEPFIDVWVPVVFMMGLTGGVVWLAWGYLTGRRRVDAVELRREGFVVVLRGAAEDYGWGDVLGFRVGMGGLTVVLLGHEGTEVPCWALGLRSDPALVAELLEFYRSNERLRGELASGAALDRIRQGTFLPEAS